MINDRGPTECICTRGRARKVRRTKKSASEGQYEEGVLKKRNAASQELDSLLAFCEGMSLIDT